VQRRLLTPAKLAKGRRAVREEGTAALGVRTRGTGLVLTEEVGLRARRCGARV